MARFRITKAARRKNDVVAWPSNSLWYAFGRNLGSSLLLACALCLALGESPAQTPAPAGATAAASTQPQKTRAHGKKAAPVAEAPAPAPVPLTPEQMAPTPPKVTYQNGLLTIDAKNSTLSQVLRAVQAQTGASIEMPSSASTDRVMMQLGPGRPRDVLNTLLNGSKFNYVILGMTDDPGRVQKVILMTRQNTPAAVNTAQNNGPGQAQPQAEEPQDEEMPPAEVEAETRPKIRRFHRCLGDFGPGKFPCVRPIRMSHLRTMETTRTVARLRSSCCRSCKICNNNSSNTSSS